jgi:hypothetical protein
MQQSQIQFSPVADNKEFLGEAAWQGEATATDTRGPPSRGGLAALPHRFYGI